MMILKDDQLAGLTDTRPDVVNDLSIVLVCWNNKDYLEPCLQSLYEGKLNCSFDVICVDNGSTDGSLEMLREKFPEIKIIENGKNVGLSKASNQGIEATKGRYILLLNNDTLVNCRTLEAMYTLLEENPNAGAAGGKLLNGDGSFQGGYAKFPTLVEEFFVASGLGVVLWPGYPSHHDSKSVCRAGWLSSACLMVRRSALEKVGLLDEEYFIYGDEADLQYRLNKAGQFVYYIPTASTIHFGGKSMNRWKRRKMVYRGRLLFFQKNYGWLPTAALRLMLGFLSLIKLVIWVVLLLLPGVRERALKEIGSNIDVIKLCLRLS